MDISDLILEQKIQTLQENIQHWAEGRQLWHDSGFRSAHDHFDSEPNENQACVTVLWSEGEICSMFNGFTHYDDLESFEAFMDTQEFYYEHDSGCTFGFYAKDEELNARYLQYFEWQWICELIKPNYTSLYQEIFDYFHLKPDLLYQLSPRKFEVLISEIFVNQGYRSELGKGQSDGGVDVRLYKKDEIDQIVTLVQVKKYKPELPVQLEAVAALSAIVNQENANRGLFVTTSRYLPVARRFAGRETSRLTLADSGDVSRWCENARNIILRDKSNLFTDDTLKQLLNNSGRQGLAGEVVLASVGYNMVVNDFCLVVKDTPEVALLMRLPTDKKYADEPYNSIGREHPILDQRILTNRVKEKVFRAKKSYDADGRVSFWGDGHLYHIWDRIERHFDYND